jgi:hypothetical protein
LIFLFCAAFSNFLRAFCAAFKLAAAFAAALSSREKLGLLALSRLGSNLFLVSIVWPLYEVNESRAKNIIAFLRNVIL